MANSDPAKPSPGENPIRPAIDPDERKMLTTICQTLYEGRWEDFALDLRARLAGQPYVFSVQPPSPKLRDTIRHHLELIEVMMKEK